jgi:hypothetical protein
MKKDHNFRVVSPAAYETSMSSKTFDRSDNVEFDCYIFFDSDGVPCGFECSDNDGQYYASGGLWTHGNAIVEYDGVFELPWFILRELKSLGYEVSDVS